MKNSIRKNIVIALALSGAAFMLVSNLLAASDWTLKDIMKQGHKGDTSLLKKVETGAATDQEKQSLLDMYKAMPTLEPPMGDAESWKMKCQALIDAMQGVVDKKETGLSDLKTATNCKACHSVHKG